MKIGVDFHGVLDSSTEFFSTFTRLFVNNGHEIHIITGHKDSIEFRKKLSEMGIVFTHIFSISSYHKSIGTPMWYKDPNNPFLEEDIWNKTKAEYCKREGIDLHIDDSEEYLNHFTTQCALYKNKK